MTECALIVQNVSVFQLQGGRSMESKICPYCGERFVKRYNESQEQWNGRGCCGSSCASLYAASQGILKNCKVCGVAIKPKAKTTRTLFYCDECRHKRKPVIPSEIVPVAIVVPVKPTKPEKPVVTERISPVNYQTQCPMCSRLAAVGEIFCNRHW
jgi:predicted RNA-binding Zn-ribbon protein involved in translation (DUF1610 family)